MEVLPLREQITIESFKGNYKVFFCHDFQEILTSLSGQSNYLFIVDKNIHKLYPEVCEQINQLSNNKVYYIEANEETKSLENMPAIIEQSLLKNEVRRDTLLVAVGGGITQDICCFLATNMFRGMNWTFIPTTLLAQADSCIGSKSSINLHGYKNLLGSFTPPNNIYIAPFFLKTLHPKDFLSGIGEMIKVHIIEGKQSFNAIQSVYNKLIEDELTLIEYIKKSLLIKKHFIELDEFDKGPRNVMNYGHSFGHAIETATQFEIPHGIAVTIGMDMANYIACKFNRITEKDYKYYSTLLRTNAKEYYKFKISFESFFNALAKDKKNVGEKLSLILLNKDITPEKVLFEKSEHFKTECKYYLEQFREFNNVT